MQNNAFFGLVAYVVDKLLPCGFITIDAVEEAVKEKGLSQGYSRMLTDFLLQEKIVTNPAGDRYDVTPLYFEIIEKGGWFNYKKLLEETEALHRSKLIYDTRLARLKLKCFWPLTVAGILGGIVSGIYIVGLFY